MALEWLAIRYAAQNRTISGRLEPCTTVSAVTDVCLWQIARLGRIICSCGSSSLVFDA